jgi:hypothetical protein
MWQRTYWKYRPVKLPYSFNVYGYDFLRKIEIWISINPCECILHTDCRLINEEAHNQSWRGHWSFLYSARIVEARSYDWWFIERNALVRVNNILKIRSMSGLANDPWLRRRPEVETSFLENVNSVSVRYTYLDTTISQTRAPRGRQAYHLKGVGKMSSTY